MVESFFYPMVTVSKELQAMIEHDSFATWAFVLLDTNNNRTTPYEIQLLFKICYVPIARHAVVLFASGAN